MTKLHLGGEAKSETKVASARHFITTFFAVPAYNSLNNLLLHITMASGYGNNGGPGRCYAFWQEVLGCYVVNSGEGENGKKKCVPALEDYHECLHHRKEALRTMKMQAAYRKAEAAHPRENAPKAEQIRSLGLLGKEEQAANVLAQR
ncbi:uncharacterized protein N7529_011550 [Penicillium soppii]|uniref:uncharacterized protein n=1 Tax=Penicillium soppii TaxID=69789 RepID=UPI002549B67F|nr:uncharacterized protein N7529_011550 [Penicillium soppii]KAJ5852165.1 hypothetical protein N7529_011550 [Penicillium soppii]